MFILFFIKYVKLDATLPNYLVDNLFYFQGDVIPHIVVNCNEADSGLYNALQEIFFEKLYQEHPQCTSTECNDPFYHGQSTGYRISIHLNAFNEDASVLDLNTDESYELNIIPPETGTIIYVVEIKANSYYGARHGVETLNQLITYDELTDSLQLFTSARIMDAPTFPYRGVMLDTARNWISIKDIKNVIDGLSYNKLNVLHWHLTDAESFPFQTSNVKILDYFRLSELSELGAYSSSKVYSGKDIQEIVQFAKIRGVNVIPEIGGPGHLYSGWKYAQDRYPDVGKLILCDTHGICTTPPCGQVYNLNFSRSYSCVLIRE